MATESEGGKPQPSLPTVTPLLFRNKHDHTMNLTNVVLLFHGAHPTSAPASSTPGHTTLPLICSVLAGAPPGTVVVLFECRIELGQISKALAQAVQMVLPPLLKGGGANSSAPNGWYKGSPAESKTVIPEEAQLQNGFDTVRDYQQGKRSARGGGMLDASMLEMLFKSGDKDQSGTLSRGEAIRCLQAAAELEPQRWFEDVYAHLATDPSSMITLEAFMALAEGTPAPSPAPSGKNWTRGAAPPKAPKEEPAAVTPRVSVMAVREGCWMAVKLLHHNLLGEMPSELTLVAPMVCRFMGPMETPLRIPTLVLYGSRDAAVLADAGSAEPRSSWERLVASDMLLTHKLQGVNGPTLELQPDSTSGTQTQPKLAAERSVGSAAREVRVLEGVQLLRCSCSYAEPWPDSSSGGVSREW